MSDLQTVRARVADYINRTDLNTQIDVEINRAIEYYAKGERFWFNEEVGTFSTVSGQLIYTSSDSIPTPIREIDLVEISLTSTNKIELEEISYHDIRNYTVNTSATGTPAKYAYYNENIYIYPIPGAVYTVTVSYVKGYAVLTAAQSNDFTTNAEDLIEARAARMIYDGILHNSTQSDRCANRELDALGALRSETQRLAGTGRITPTSF